MSFWFFSPIQDLLPVVILRIPPELRFDLDACGAQTSYRVSSHVKPTNKVIEKLGLLVPLTREIFIRSFPSRASFASPHLATVLSPGACGILCRGAGIVLAATVQRLRLLLQGSQKRQTQLQVARVLLTILHPGFHPHTC